jgi:hypothetical protein
MIHIALGIDTIPTPLVSSPNKYDACAKHPR